MLFLWLHLPRGMFYREPLITRFQSISCRNQISINFCLVLLKLWVFYWGLWILFSNISIFNFKIEWMEIFGEFLGITVTKVWQICSHTLCHWRKSFQMLVGRRGLEPRTTWLKVRCSTSWATDPQGTFKTSRESKKVNK